MAPRTKTKRGQKALMYTANCAASSAGPLSRAPPPCIQPGGGGGVAVWGREQLYMGPPMSLQVIANPFNSYLSASIARLAEIEIAH